MPLRTESLDEPQLNLTPMIDIVFLLIIFFMVGTRFSEIEQQYDIELPTAQAVSPMSSRPDAIVLNVARSGDITVNGDQVTQQQLKTQLEAARKAYAEQAVVIRGDGSGLYQAIIDVLDVCQQAQITKLSLAYHPVTDGESP
ncbi:MAG: biopolymer transporter ExbD [Fuerstiella sp.]